MNVVIYARYSSHSQTEASIEGQLKVCHEYCERNNYTIVDEYIDRAISGTTDHRPAFLRMIEDSSKKYFQYVIVYQLDRFARNRYDSAKYKMELKKNGVRVLSARETITDDASGILLESVIEGIAEYYSAELSQKIRRGMDLKAEKCLAIGGYAALGYVIDKERKYQIDPKTAPIVQYIFQEYANGATIKSIIDHLNEQGYKTSTGGPFNKNSLRTILQNKRYIGIYTYRGREIPNGMPRIISDELFEKVSVIMDKNRRAPARSKAKNEYILTTKLFCGYCKEMMTGISAKGHMGVVYYYYSCNNRKKKLCHKKNVHKDYIEDLIVSECRKLLTDKNIDRISKEVMKLYDSEASKTSLKRLQKQLSENERKHNNMVESIAECDDSDLRKTFFAKLKSLEEEHRILEREITEEKKLQPKALTVSHIKFFLNSLKKGDIKDVKYRKVLIDVFINAIYLYDDKLTLILNSGDKPVTINDKLLSALENNNRVAEGLFLDKPGPACPHCRTAQWYCRRREVRTRRPRRSQTAWGLPASGSHPIRRNRKKDPPKPRKRRIQKYSSCPS